jgi:hypothetical protein
MITKPRERGSHSPCWAAEPEKIIRIKIIMIIINWYEHVPKSVETSREGKVTILWNQQIQTDRTIPSNKPDIVICNYENGTCMLIGVAIPGDRNIIQKEAENILKYKEGPYNRNTVYVECKN